MYIIPKSVLLHFTPQTQDKPISADFVGYFKVLYAAERDRAVAKYLLLCSYCFGSTPFVDMLHFVLDDNTA